MDYEEYDAQADNSRVNASDQKLLRKPTLAHNVRGGDSDSILGESLIRPAALDQDEIHLQFEEGYVYCLKQSDRGADNQNEQALGDQSEDDNKDDEQAEVDDDEAQIVAKTTDHESNMQRYIQDYGTEFDIPGLYILEAKVYPLDRAYSVQVVKYSLPSNLNMEVKTFYSNGCPPTKETLGDTYSHPKYHHAGLRLVLMTDSSMKTLTEIAVPKAERYNVSFSSDGQYMAVFMKKLQRRYNKDGGDKVKNRLDIYKIEEGDIFSLFESIDNQRDPYTQFFDAMSEFRLRGVREIKFDLQDRYLVCVGLYRANFILLETEDEKAKFVHEFKLDAQKEKRLYFNQILDLHIDADWDKHEDRILSHRDGDRFKRQKKLQFRCEVACTVKGQSSVAIFNIEEDQETVLKTTSRKVSFANKNLDHVHAKISRDFGTVIVANESENFLLKHSDNDMDGVDYDQTSLSWLKGKVIRRIIYAGPSHFFFVCCKHYDRDLDIQSSLLSTFKISIKRRISPNSISVLDALQFPVDGVDEDDGDDIPKVELGIVSMRDSELFVDYVSPYQWHHCDDPERQHERYHMAEKDARAILQEFSKQETEGLCFHWPYITFNGFEDHQVIINASKPDHVVRVNLPQGIDRIAKAFISEQFDLFLLAEIEQSYCLLKIDMDQYKKPKLKEGQYFKYKEVMRFYKVEVQNHKLLDFHVRSKAKESKLGVNSKLQAFFLFNGAMYSWAKGQESVQKIRDSASAYIERVNDSNICYAAIDKLGDREIFKYIKIKVEFSQFQELVLFQDKQEIDVIKSFGYDEARDILILFKRSRQKKAKGKKLVITDLSGDGENELYNQAITDTELVGRLKNMRYLFVDGHIYYSNKIIKLRYDILTNQTKSYKTLGEYELFDYYKDILNLGLDLSEEFGDKNILKLTISDNMPLSDHLNHRLAYVKSDLDRYSLKKILILPYLHERKIYLNHQKKDCDYFNTTMRLDSAASKSMKSSKYGSSIRSSRLIRDAEVDFISINLTDNKYHYFNIKGILQHRVDFTDTLKQYKCGRPVSVSNDGTIFVYKKQNSLKLHICRLQEQEFQHVKTIKLSKAIDKYLEWKSQDSGEPVEDLQEGFDIHGDGKFASYSDKQRCFFEICVNDKMDVAVLIRPKNYKNEGENKDKNSGQPAGGIRRATTKKQFNNKKLLKGIAKGLGKQLEEQQQALVYIEEGRYFEEDDDNKNNEAAQGLHQKVMGVLKSKEKGRRGQNLFITNPKHSDANKADSSHECFKHGFTGFSVNKKHLFFWNESNVWMSKLRMKGELEFKEIGFGVSPQNKQTIIKRVRTGSVKGKIAIIVKQSQTSQFFILWNTEQDNELESFDHGQNPRVFWDQAGNTYVTEEDKVFIAEQGVCLTCYDVSEINQTKQKKKSQAVKQFGQHQGFRFDSHQHSWLYLQQYISLSYSYMTSLMNRQMQQKQSYVNDDYLFDVEQYNYVMYKQSSLSDEELLNAPDKLEYILKNFEMIDERLLEQLQYYYIDFDEKTQQEVRVTPLHIAFKKQNNKSVNIILKYLARIDYAQFKTFRDIFPKMIDFAKFPDFLEEQTFQTLQMANKQSMKVDAPFSDTIIAIGDARSSFVDDDYYEKFENEESQDAATYPVKVQCLEIGWIINEPEGLQFLTKVYESQNLDIYDVPAIFTLVEFLHYRYKTAVVKMRGVMYVVQFVVYMLTVAVHESLNQQRLAHDDDVVRAVIEDKPEAGPDGESEAGLADYIHADNKSNINRGLGFLNLLCAFYQIGLMGFQAHSVGRGYWETKWAITDIVYTVLNIIISIMIMIYSENDDSVAWLRRLEAVAALVISFKALYFAELIVKLAPIIQTILKMLSDSIGFMIILLIVQFAFVVSFWLLGKNQLQYDSVPTESEDFPSYTTFDGACSFIYEMSLGEVGGFGMYEVGAESHQLPLWIVFILASFTLIIHMMNMLIAIMTNTFEENQAVQNLIISKTKLRFVIDNFNLFQPFGTVEDKQKISYIVTALLNEEEEEDIELIKEVHEDFDLLREDHQKKNQNVMLKLHRLSNRVKQLTNTITKNE